MTTVKRFPEDPFGLSQYAAERFGLNPHEITHIEAIVDPRDIPHLIVTLACLPERPASP